MKILMLNYEYPPLGGGAGVVTKYHAEGLAERGYQVTVVTTWFEGEKEDEQVNNNLRIVKLKSKRKVTYKSSPIEMLSWIFLAKEFTKTHCKKEKYNLTFAHFTIPGGIVARYLKLKLDIPYIVISHGEDIPFINKKRMFKFHIATYFLIKNICKNALKNIMLTSTLKNNINNFLGEKFHDKNIDIPNGCKIEDFYPEYNQRIQKLKILFIGRLTDVKEPFVFLESLKKFKQTNDKFEAYIIGDGELKEKMLKYVTENDLENNTHFTGWLNKKEVREHYQSSHIQVMTSRFEAFSITALEATFCGLYLISTPVSGNIDIIEEGINGNIIDFGNSTQIANALDDYYKKKFSVQYRIPIEWHTNFVEKYSWETILNSYQTVIANNCN